MNPGWEHFDHQADIGIRGYGRTMAEAFEQVGVALTAVITVPARVHPDEKVDVQCEAPDREMLLADWLNIILREMSARKMLFSRYQVAMEGNWLRGELWGENLDRVRHEPVVEVKGASYHHLEVVEDGQGGWIVQCIVDV